MSRRWPALAREWGDPYRCPWCPYRGVVPSLVRDHMTRCPNRPQEDQ